jgi:chemotaxis protein MotA
MADTTQSGIGATARGGARVGRPAGTPVGTPRLLDPPRRNLDLATLLGLSAAVALIVAAIALSGSTRAFFDLPSILMVVLGTLAITAISYTGRELRRALPSFMQALLRANSEPTEAARRILQLADKARKMGILQLQSDLLMLRAQPFLYRALMQVIDGMPVDEVDRNAQTEIQATMASRQQAASMLRRAAEVAPAMGLIGTLVGLVQMLGSLESPETIGPAMSVALLTTLYGALMANVVFLPLANKLERNAAVEQLTHQIFATGITSMGRQENPRRLEMALNTMLPVGSHVKYFD